MSSLQFQRCVLASVALIAVTPATAPAQTSSLSQAILALPSTINDSQRLISDARLFSGIIRAVIVSETGTPQLFQDGDQISFLALPRTGAGPGGVGFATPFVGTRVEFEAWARANAANLLQVFFPGGLSGGLTGRDTATLYSQQLLLTTVLGVNDAETRGRNVSPGLFDVEWLRRDADQPGNSSWALQGLYGITPTLSVQGRYGRQPGRRQESLSSSATSLAVDYHPFIERGSAVIIRAGGTARAGFVYSNTESADQIVDPIRFGALDFAGGGWVSAQRQVGPVLVGGGALLQGTKHYLPPGEEGTFRNALATALNDRGLEYDLTLGATARADVSRSTSVIVSYAETQPLESSVDRSAAHLVMGGVVYALGPAASLNAGYKVTSLAGGLAQSLFFQGSYGW